MICIRSENQYGITVNGHAGQAEQGKDVVCAGVSAIVQALAECLERNRDSLSLCEVEIQSGYARIHALPSEAFEQECKGIFAVARCGLEQLSKAFPQFVKIF